MWYVTRTFWIVRIFSVWSTVRFTLTLVIMNLVELFVANHSWKDGIGCAKPNLVWNKLLSLYSWNMRYPSSNFFLLLFIENFYSCESTFHPCNHILPVVFFSFFNFLIPMTTETIHNSCYFQFKCSIQILIMMLNEASVKNSPLANLNIRLHGEFFSLYFCIF